MTYQDTLTFLLEQLPIYQRVGRSAMKKDLTNIRALSEHLENPHHKFTALHIAGTNGKGSSAHMLAAILQSAGYKTGLYTSPHLKDFTERIRIDGKPIPRSAVVQFVEYNQAYLASLQPSFFEMTVAMAFDYFAREQVDIAVVEVGLGGRLDSTNILTPLLSLITNIGLDHTDMLGDTLAKIAYEKAGIIKPGIPVVVGSYHPETLPVFKSKAQQEDSPLLLAFEEYRVVRQKVDANYQYFSVYHQEKLIYPEMKLALLGSYQQYNLVGVLASVNQLLTHGFTISEQHLRAGLQAVSNLTGLKGRWQVLGSNPTVVADTGHNREALEEIVRQISQHLYRNLRMVLGFVQEKDLNIIFRLLPTSAKYYFCQPDIPRAMPLSQVVEAAQQYQLDFEVVSDVNQALRAAQTQSASDDFIFVGGSTFVVAELEI
ncbi:bifunctional folylpolyglutamate synthase/dihydrofolate synthase [Tunicatimonas pelagia]|uniref:bifunctional folylpolyglutamate synthase/dihydrofolate synthase n=1 Tax=Tunicatimonas pelagia TaxID=931531 RepID=UPI0026653036|nr:folylpolyglutamate synthase/dihydrofolate synthase family protein [Tunicatimonas pelagia]WKN43652.1 bifunctional folylpolyglutamate synthase/dihydrofolate synthase [Tunicatimonas pelagia]